MAPRGRLPIALSTGLLLGALACCQKPDSTIGQVRIAVPPPLLKSFEAYEQPRGRTMAFVALRPYSRARDLEVLLFSSRSTAFQGVVLPGRFLPELKPWLSAFPEGAAAGVRADVLESVGGRSPIALPLTLDFGVLVIRRDLWKTLALPAPTSLAGLRDAALTLRSRNHELSAPILNDLPLDELFWDLGWSFEGAATPSLYTFPKVHALDFIREFDLEKRPDSTQHLVDLLRKGRCAVVFTTLQKGIDLCSADTRLEMLALPAVSGRALVIYSGWCLTKLSSPPPEEALLSTLDGIPFQHHLTATGLVAVREGESLVQPKAALVALRNTEIHGAPDLGPGGDEVVFEALRDATETPMTAEEALRRAAARLEQVQEKH